MLVFCAVELRKDFYASFEEFYIFFSGAQRNYQYEGEINPNEILDWPIMSELTADSYIFRLAADPKHPELYPMPDSPFEKGLVFVITLDITFRKRMLTYGFLRNDEPFSYSLDQTRKIYIREDPTEESRESIIQLSEILYEHIEEYQINAMYQFMLDRLRKLHKRYGN